MAKGERKICSEGLESTARNAAAGAMRFCLFISLLLGTLLQVTTGETALSLVERKQAAELYEHVFGGFPPDLHHSHSRIQNLTVTDRELVARWLHERKAESRARGTGDGSSLDVYLENLGDDWALQAFAERFRKQPGADWRPDFERIRNAKLIPMIGDLLFREEAMYYDDDLGFLPAQVTAAQGLIVTMRYAPQFLGDVSQWAVDLDMAWYPPDDVIHILRDWYRENEEKLRAGAFFDVRPGRMPQPVAAAATPSPNAQLAPQVATEARTAPTPAAPVEKRETASSWLMISAAVVLLLLAGFVLLWTRLRQPQQ